VSCEAVMVMENTHLACRGTLETQTKSFNRLTTPRDGDFSAGQNKTRQFGRHLLPGVDFNKENS